MKQTDTVARQLNSFRESTGRPIINGQLWFYDDEDRNKLKDTFSDNKGKIKNPNPIFLDSNGSLKPQLIYFKTKGHYYIALKNSKGKTLDCWSHYKPAE